MDCTHAVTARDPTDRAIAHHDHVCLTCGIVGCICDRCQRLIPYVRIFELREDWCYWCWCCNPCCGQTDQPLTPSDIIAAIDYGVGSVAENYIRRCILEAPDRDEAIAIARRECSKGGRSSNTENISGVRDAYNRGRGITAEFGHRIGVVTWAQIADYVRAPHELAQASVPAQQLALFE